MVVKKTDRLGVIESARRLFRRNGYHNTSMADIGADCGLLKGSIYHYFPSKEDLALAVITREFDEARETIFTLAFRPGQSERQRLEALCQAVKARYMTSEGGCLLANMALEISNVLPDFVPPIRDFFDTWLAAVARLLEPRFGPHRARELAADAVARFQGALMLFRLDPRAEAMVRRAHLEVVALLD